MDSPYFQPLGRGCVKLSPACAHCYAETWARRVGMELCGGMPLADSSPMGTGATHSKVEC